MEIDDKLKNRLAGAAVITALAVIFLPMLFDDPVAKKGQVVSEVDIPHKPEASSLLTTSIVPDKTSEVTDTSDTASTETAAEQPEDAANDAEQPTKPAPDSDLEKQAETEPADLIDEKSPPPKKKLHKKEVVATAPEDTHVAEEKPQVSERKWHKKTPVVVAEKSEAKAESKPKVDKEPKKVALPSLDSTGNEKPSLPSLDNHRRFIQVASLSDQSKATALRDKLREQGFPATVDSAWIAGKGRVYRLKVGPELDAQKAEAMKNKINQLNKVNSITIVE